MWRAAGWTVKQCVSLTLPSYHLGLDAQLFGNKILLAAAFQDDSVTLFRLDEKRAVQLSQVCHWGDRFSPLLSRDNDNLFVGVYAMFRTSSEI